MTCSGTAADAGMIKELPHSIHKVDSKNGKDGGGKQKRGKAEGDFWYGTSVLHYILGQV